MRGAVLDPIRRWLDHQADEFTRMLDTALSGCESVLDVGCGSFSPLQALPRRPRRLVGVDGHAPAIDESRRRGIHDEYQCISLLDIGRAFEPLSFDAVVLLDVLEHFEKPAGASLLEQAERLASRKVVVFTPNGFLPQGELHGNPYQLHRSGWSAREMQERGYDVLGVNGWKPLRGNLAEICLRPRLLWWLISLASQPAVRMRPQHAFQLLCVRKLCDPSPAAPAGSARRV